MFFMNILSLCVTLGFSSAQLLPLPPTRLQVEYLSSPVRGMDIKQPRFSWHINENTHRGVMQEAYQLQVCLVPAGIRLPVNRELNSWPCNDGQEVVWDSDRVNTSSHWGIVYEGEALTDDTSYVWRVRWWGKTVTNDSKPLLSSVSPYSAIALLETGFIGGVSSLPGGAKWISISDEDFNSTRLGTTQIRSLFNIPSDCSTVTRARVFVASPGYYSLMINGEEASDSVLGAFTVFTRKILYDVHDVTDLLTHSVRQSVALTLGNGWYSQPTVALGPRMVSVYISVQYNNTQGIAHNITVGSSNSWRVTQGPSTVADIYLGTVHDARLETPGWELKDYTEPPGRWSAALEVATPLLSTGFLRAHLLPPIRRCEVFQPQSVVLFESSKFSDLPVWVVDFGQNIAGVVRIQVPADVVARASAGSYITIRHAETTWNNGSLHHLYGEKVNETIVYILNDTSDRIVYEPKFTYMGFRYIEVGGTAFQHLSSKDFPIQVEALFTHTDFERAGSVQTSSPLLNSIIHAAEYSQLGNWMSLPTDCTQRERRGWLGDAQIASEGLMHTTSGAAAYTKFLDDIALTQVDEWNEHNGSIPEVCPNYGHGSIPPDPPFGAAYAVLVWNSYRYYSDSVALRTHYNGVKAFAETLVARAGGNNHNAGTLNVSLSTHGDWVSVANSSTGATTCSGRAALDHYANATCCLFMECPDAVLNGFYYVMQFRILSAMAKVLGNDSDKIKYSQLAQSAAENLRKTQYNHDTKRLGYNYQADIALGLALDLFPSDDEGIMITKLVSDIVDKRTHLSTGMFGTKVLFPTLSSHMQGDLAYDVLTQKSAPSWGAWIETQKATTLFEMWGAFDGDPSSSGVASRNHVMFSSFLPWVYQVLGGVAMEDNDFGTSVLPPDTIDKDYTHTGYSTFYVAPRLLGDLQSMYTSLVTMRGNITVSWAVHKHSLVVNVSLPVGDLTPVSIPLPRDSACVPSNTTVKELLAEEVVWSKGVFRKGAEGIFNGTTVDNAPSISAIRFTVGSGSYSFFATC
eukprot:m.346415 g.346415  ORF g.346415 m.346415 type:complete len:1026 (-) comp29031_c0_seq1:57-3134(-)